MPRGSHQIRGASLVLTYDGDEETVPFPDLNEQEAGIVTLPPNPDQPEAQGPNAPQQPAAPQVHPVQPTSQPPVAPPAPAAPQYAPPVVPPTPATPVAPAAPVAPQYGAPAAPQQPYGAPQQPYGAPQQPAQPYGTPQHQQQPYQQQYGVPQYPSAMGIAPSAGGPFDGAHSPDDMTRPLYGATFGQSISRFFKGYVKFNGRASRSEYWWSALFIFLISLVPVILLAAGYIWMISSLYSYSYNTPGGAIALMIVGGILYAIVGFGTLLPSFAIGWRRLHDGNFAGPLYLLVLGSYIPLIGWIGSIVVFVFTIMPSKAEGRRFDRP